MTLTAVEFVSQRRGRTLSSRHGQLNRRGITQTFLKDFYRAWKFSNILLASINLSLMKCYTAIGSFAKNFLHKDNVSVYFFLCHQLRYY